MIVGSEVIESLTVCPCVFIVFFTGIVVVEWRVPSLLVITDSSLNVNRVQFLDESCIWERVY